MVKGEGEGEVATLIFHHASHPKQSRSSNIFANDEFDIGRENIRCHWDTTEPTISTHHLRFRCVMFEDGDDKVAPLVYMRVLSANPIVLKNPSFNSLDDQSVLTRDSGDVLLNHGDVLQLNPDISLVFEAKKSSGASTNHLDSIKRAEVKRFENQYLVTGRVLGTGGNASVFVAVKQSTQQQIACKIVRVPQEQSGTDDTDEHSSTAQDKAAEAALLKKRADLTREYNILRDLDHPNIICLEKVFCATSNIYIFQELITGGDLLSYIELMHALSEPQALMIMKQVITAVEYLHSRQIVHRDIKPENVLMTSWRDGARVVLTDFGQARTLEDAKSAARQSNVFRMQSIVGTYGYTAPEVYQQLQRDLQQNQGYSKAIDVWSIGCLAATLLTNEIVFPGADEEAAADSESDGARRANLWDVSILDARSDWQSIGRKAKAFVKGCLELDESRRLTAKQALLHEWFTNKHYAAELNAAYKRAVADWNPGKSSGSPIEYIDTAYALSTVKSSQRADRMDEATRSPHFPQAQRSQQPSGLICNAQYHQLAPKLSHTPLPGIGDSSSSPIDQSPHPDPTTDKNCPDASPIRVSNLPDGDTIMNTCYLEEPSFASVQYRQMPSTLSNTFPPAPIDWNSDLTQSQPMLDQASIPRFAPQTSFRPA